MFLHHWGKEDDPLNGKELAMVRNWTLTGSPHFYGDYLTHGLYRFEVRAIDPAGNKDPYLEIERNVVVSGGGRVLRLLCSLLMDN